MNLSTLTVIPGVRGAALVGRDGLALEAHGRQGEHLAAELAALRETLERFARRLETGNITRLAFTSEQYEVVAVAAGNFLAGVAITRGSDTRAAQQELARIATGFAEKVPA